MKLPDVVVEGKENGEGMIIHSQTRKGTEIYGLGIPNVYMDYDWSLGPTWCYLIMGKKKTLIDAHTASYRHFGRGRHIGKKEG